MSQGADRPPRRHGRALGVAAAVALSAAALLPGAAPGRRAAAGIGLDAAAAGPGARLDRPSPVGSRGAPRAKDGPGAELGAEAPGSGEAGRPGGLTASEEARLRWLEARLAKVKAREKAIAAREGALQQVWRKAADCVGKRRPGLGSSVPAYPWDVGHEARAGGPRFPWEAVYGTQGQFLERLLLAPEEARRLRRAAG
ncbi:unnamed protein product [Prorocentrum cordatum]|uniref:Uncharacterized protein n=1 Tax=Prorocentrum cordatum TaxID=2364126 RepID=A0ABN9SZE7_9DINO|nr:unnamed protein product [Polarella glacialis]